MIPDNYWKGQGAFNKYGIDRLSNRYLWPRNKNGKDMNFTISLKKKKHEDWLESENNLEKLLNIAEFIVKDWGGIRGNKLQTINQHVQMCLENLKLGKGAIFPFKGVASYSKILGIIDPQRFAILDARVVVSLNAIQLIENQKNGIFFPYLDGRNNITGNVSNKRGFRYDKRFRSSSALFERWEKPSKERIYQIYIDFMRETSKRLGVELYILEMSLFADAESLAEQCIEEIN